MIVIMEATQSVRITKEWLEFSKSQGNDLITPRYGFPGLKPGDSWCLCASRWKEAYMNGIIIPFNIAATNMRSLQTVEGN